MTTTPTPASQLSPPMKARYLVKIRRANGMQVKPEAEQVDGKEWEFTRGWLIEDDNSRYPGEWAMIPVRGQGWPIGAPTWVATGDLVELPSPARSDKDAEREFMEVPPVGADCWMFAVVAEAIASHTKAEPEEALVDAVVARVQELRRHEVRQVRGIIATQSVAAKAQESVPSSEGIDISKLTRWTFDGGMTAEACKDGKWVSFSDLEALARRATAGTTAAPISVELDVEGLRQIGRAWMEQTGCDSLEDWIERATAGNAAPTDAEAVGTIDGPEFQAILDDMHGAAVEAHACGNDHGTGAKLSEAESKLVAFIDARIAALRAAPAGQHHADDEAVGRFAVAMKAKMAAARGKGRGGWDNPAQCTVEHLQILLLEHLAKGDPVDVGNFCMMLWARDAPVAAIPVGAAIGNDGAIYHNVAEAYWQAECAEALHMWLDDQGVPRVDAKAKSVLSLVGRVVLVADKGATAGNAAPTERFASQEVEDDAREAVEGGASALRAEPASQHDSVVRQLAHALRNANLLLAETFISTGRAMSDRAANISRQIERALVDADEKLSATRCRAEGGVTCNNSSANLATSAAAPGDLPKWIDNMKGSDPTMDGVIEYIEKLLGNHSAPDIDKVEALADNLYNRGYRDARQERDQDARGCEEWQVVVDAIAARAAPLDAAPQKQLAHGHRDDYFLLANARRIAQHPIAMIRTMPNWVLASELFATGSRSANQICVDAGIDPDAYKVERAPSPVSPVSPKEN